MKKIVFLFLVFSILFGFNHHASAKNPLGSYGEAFSDVKVVGNYAYVASGYGLKIFDISNPSSPKLMSTYKTDGYPRRVFISGTTAYVAGWSGLAIIDISDPSSPKLQSSYNTGGSAFDVFVSGNIAYVANFFNGFAI